MNITETTEASLSPDLLPQSYLNEFSRHQLEFKAHLRGRVPGTQPLPPTYFPPASYWTSAEKDLFFHGLTIYSRLRPDLIAEHIKTKNIFDVCLYLDCLEIGASQAGPAPEIDFNDEEKPRNITEPAMEVSEEWIQHEEIMAARINASVSCPWTLGTEAKSQCLCPGVGLTEDKPSSPSRKIGKAYLAHLDFGSLSAVESIIKDEERKQDPRSTPFEVAAHTGVMPGTPHPQDDMSSPDVELPSTQEEKLASPSVLAEHADSHDPIAHRRLQKRLYMRRKRAEKTGRVITLKAVRLRPGRASNGRKEASTQVRKSPEIEVSPTSAPSTPRIESENDFCMHNTGPEATVDGEQAAVEEEQRKGGLNKAYRVKQVLLENGTGAGVLSKMNLDLFHLTSFSRILNLFRSFNGPSNSADTSSISADTVHLLSAVVVEFVSELIRRAIITKEQEIRLKQSLPIWKYDKYEISGEHLQECLKSMGLDHLNKSNYFNREANRLRQPLPVTAACRTDSRQSFQASSRIGGTVFTLPDSMIWCSLPAYRKLFPTDEMAPDFEDETLLGDEISEEQQASFNDNAVSKLYEESLWTTHYSK